MNYQQIKNAKYSPTFVIGEEIILSIEKDLEVLFELRSLRTQDSIDIILEKDGITLRDVLIQLFPLNNEVS